jgi:esterase/lipase superfamily enzyme
VRIHGRSLNALAFVLALACGSCGGRLSQGALVPVTTTAEGTSLVPILVATTRQRSTTDQGEMFSGERAAEVSYAAITVSIPPDATRKIGEVQWPTSLPGDPRTNFVTVSAEYIDKQAFTKSITTIANQTGRTKVLVFVHGFNNRFDEAVYRLAQIVHDSKVPAIPVLFTWPSRGEVRLRTYNYDRESANYSRDALESLLAMLTSYPSITEVNLLAHSMGNWVALEALRGRSMRGGQTLASIKADKLRMPCSSPRMWMSMCFVRRSSGWEPPGPELLCLCHRTTQRSGCRKPWRMMLPVSATSILARSRIEASLSATRYLYST